MLANVRARHADVFLILAIDDLAHAFDEQARFVLFQQCVPIIAPDDLDDVPAGTAEEPFQFLNDLAVAADRTVESLQVAVDDEDQVVQLFAASQRDGAERFWFVAFAVAQEGPDLLLSRVCDATIFAGTR